MEAAKAATARILHFPRAAIVPAPVDLPGFGDGEGDTHPDAALLALGRVYEAHERKCRKASDMAREACERVHAALVVPEALRPRENDVALGLPKVTSDRYDAGLVRKLRASPRTRDVRTPITDLNRGNLPHDAHTRVGREPWPEAQARVDEIVAASEQYEADKCRLEDALGLTQAETLSNDLEDEATALRAAISALQASTLDGLLVKARAVVHIYGGAADEYVEAVRTILGVGSPGGDMGLTHAILRDLVRLAERAGLQPERPAVETHNAIWAGLAAAPKPDPIFAAIEAHKAAEREWLAAVAISSPLREETPDGKVAHARTNNLNDAEKDALWEMVSTAPTTLAGLTALLAYLPTTQYVSEHNFDGDELNAFLKTLNTSVASIRQEV
ncbi:hypothetical protein F0L46_04925 [Salinarimonas soli]|uniref:Uncharacterized protein n=2 Tax=Salinarimonas soli TaxID=1638099 RepID=A0A5B2VQT5_9HYPH|nr:hypothetical protein F0L46_04925 [Salinarimonas soli]